MGPEALKVVEDDGSESEECGNPRASSSDCDETVNNRKKNGVWIKLLILVSIFAVGLIAYKAGFFKLFLNKKCILAFLESLGPLSFVGFVLIQAAQVVLAPIPGELTGLIGGYVYGPVWGVVLSTIGLVLGSFVAFSLSRAFGRPFVDRVVSQATMERFDYLLHHKGLFLIFMLFLMPGFPKDYLCLILGLGHLTTVEFLVISSVGRFMGTVLLTLGGGYIRYQQYEKLYILIGLALVVFMAAFALRGRVEDLLRSRHSRGRRGKVTGPVVCKAENRRRDP